MKFILELIKQMEMDIANFYKKLSNYNSLKNEKKLFEWMSDHSMEHEHTIKKLTQKFELKPLDKQKFIQFNNRIKNELLKKITESNDIDEICVYLAEAEDLMGDAYDYIANFLETNSKIYYTAAKEIRKIANEERMHKKMILDRNVNESLNIDKDESVIYE